jgi:regulator of protease activity HflC (stomatin/prohibitin superfamily)
MTGLLAQIPYQVLVLLGSALVTVFKSIAFVQEGQRGVKLRFGKAVRYQTGKNAGQPMKEIRQSLNLTKDAESQ